MFFTQFNLADIMVTIMSTFYIVVEDWQREQRQFNIVKNIIDRIMLKESTQFKVFKQKLIKRKEEWKTKKDFIIELRENRTLAKQANLYSLYKMSKLSLDELIEE